MTDDNPPDPKMSRKALEMVMRDVLDGLNDLAVLKSWEISSDVMQILSIEPADQAQPLCPEQTPTADAARPDTPERDSAPRVVPMERYRNRRAG